MDESSNIFQNYLQPNLLTRDEYERALIRVDTIFFARKGTPEGDELDLLLDAIVNFEKVHFPFEDTKENS